MEPKKYKLPVLIDLCGGNEKAVRAMFPHLVLKPNGLWMNWEAGEQLAYGLDQHYWRSRPPHMSDADYMALADRMCDHRRTAEAIGWTWQAVASREVAALPIPFTSFELAAFMYAGDGRYLYDHFDFGAVISEDDLEELRPGANANRKAMNARFLKELHEVDRGAPTRFADALQAMGYQAEDAREAMTEAIRLVKLAEAKFPRIDDIHRTATNWLLNEACGELFQDTTTGTVVPDETPKERRDRLLKWKAEEIAKGPERGALARVTAREKLIRPTADRSNIGRDIQKAEKERAEERRAGPFDGL